MLHRGDRRGHLPAEGSTRTSMPGPPFADASGIARPRRAPLLGQDRASPCAQFRRGWLRAGFRLVGLIGIERRTRRARRDYVLVLWTVVPLRSSDRRSDRPRAPDGKVGRSRPITSARTGSIEALNRGSTPEVRSTGCRSICEEQSAGYAQRLSPAEQRRGVQAPRQSVPDCACMGAIVPLAYS